MNDITSIQRVKTLALGEIPKHGNTVLATGGAKRTVRRDGHGVNIALMASKVVAQLAVGQVPHLDKFIPTSRDDDGVAGHWREANARHPLGVALGLRANGVLALSQGVPELDSAIARSGDDLTVVYGEGDGENVLGVAEETAGGGTGVDVPKTESAVPRAGKAELAIRRDHNVLDGVAVALATSEEIIEEKSLFRCEKFVDV